MSNAINEGVVDIEKTIQKLSKEVQQIKQDGTEEVKRIEIMLDAKYAENKRLHPIDRSQEPEIDSFIISMNDLVYNKKGESKQKIDSVLNSVRWRSFTSFRDPKLTPYKDKVKNIVKQHIEELKAIFEEVDSRTAKFHKKGISKENLRMLIKIMSDIWNEGEPHLEVFFNEAMVAKGAIPSRYYKKILKWEMVADSIPNDLERNNRQQEASEEWRTKKKFEKAKEELTLLEKELSSFEEALNKLDLKKARKQNNDFEKQYASSQKDILNVAESNEQEIKGKIDELIVKKDNLCNSKLELNSALAETFVLAFGKKKELKKQILVLDGEITKINEDINNYQNDILSNKTVKEKRLLKLDRERANLRKRVEDVEAEIHNIRKKIELQETYIETKKAEISLLKITLDNFHTGYLIKKYGNKTDYWETLYKKYHEIEQLQESVKVLH